MELREFIKVYDDIVDPNVCRNAIELFNKDDSVVRLEKPQMSSLNMTIRSEKDKDHDWVLCNLKLSGQSEHVHSSMLWKSR